MNIFAVFSLLSAMMSFSLGILVQSKDLKSVENRLFMFYCLLGTYTSFVEFGLRQAESFNTAYLWVSYLVLKQWCFFVLLSVKMGAFWPFMIAFLVQFALVFTEHTKLPGGGGIETRA